MEIHIEQIEKLTAKKLDTLPPGRVFAQGLTVDSPQGAHMAGTGKPLKWVAVTGWCGDWSIYVYFDTYTFQEVAEYGDKVHSTENIQRLVPCDKSALCRYRH